MEGFNGNTFSLFLTHKSHVRLTKINNINNVFKMAFTILDYVNNKNVCSYYTFLNKPCIYIYAKLNPPPSTTTYLLPDERHHPDASEDVLP